MATLCSTRTRGLRSRTPWTTTVLARSTQAVHTGPRMMMEAMSSTALPVA